MEDKSIALDTYVGTRRQAIAVVANKSWYEGFVPLFVYFAQRACPQVDVLVFIMGTVDISVRRALNAAGCDPKRYRIIKNYGLAYGQSPLAAKIARWVLPLHAATNDYSDLYIGDIDMLLAIESGQDLFSQHKAHAERLGIPISNIVRPGTNRLTGLHFMCLDAYRAKATVPMKKLRRVLVNSATSSVILKSLYPDPGGDEKALYDLVKASDPQWIPPLQMADFRPHHGVHLGLFRKQGRIGSMALEAINSPDSDLPRYWADVAPTLSYSVDVGIWDKLFSAFPNVEISCRQFLSFYKDLPPRKLSQK